ncbi:MAG TPA: DUF2304 domain-containing protein [Nitrospirota bacterium]|nr:DUF2304 domain-containing protein [Nitrospirota bacterium]
MDLLQLMAVVGSGLLLLTVVELIRRGRLKERYSLLWLAAGIILIVLSSSRQLLEYIARLLGIFYPPSFLFLLAFLFLLLITLHFSVVISGVTEKNKQLAQEIALLKQELQKLKEDSSRKGEDGGKGK